MAWWKRQQLDADERGAPAPDDDFWYESTPGATVSIEDAMCIAAWHSGIRYIAETLASCEVHVRRRLSDQGDELAPDHPLYYVLHESPHDLYTAFEYWDRVVRDVLSGGAHISRLEEDSRRNVIRMEPLRLDSITRDAQTGIRLFRCSTDDGRSVQPLVDSEVFYVPGPGCTPWRVLSLVEQHADVLAISQTARRYVKNYFSHGALPPVFATFPVNMGVKSVKEWSEWFTRWFGGARNVGKRVPTIPNGGKLESLALKHNEMQLLELQQFYIVEVARILRVPPHKIMDLTRSTNNNIEHQSIEAVADCIRPMAERIENRLAVSLFGPREGKQYFAEFDLDLLLRGDSAAQATLMAAEIQNAVSTPNEWRKIRKRNRYDDPLADSLFIQGATVPINQAGAKQQPAMAAEDEVIDFDQVRGKK